MVSTACNYSYMQLGLVDYNARFYSPALGRFIQPDTIIPSLTHNQAWNRYSYVLNSPIMYVDPSGHLPCMDDGYCGNPNDYSYQKHIYTNAIASLYQWNLEGNWKLDEIKAIYETGKDIESYVDDLTDGKGKEWMNENMGNISLTMTDKDAGSAVPGKIDLPSWWDGGSKYDKYYLAHELAHIWDIKTGHIGILGAVDGPADHLNDFINVLANEDKGVYGKWANRFGGGTGKKHIPDEYLYTRGVMRYKGQPYGNKSTADYLAESFALNVYYPERNYVHPHVTLFVNTYISVQASYLP